MSSVMLTFSSADEMVPPQRPGLDEFVIVSTGIPSRHQVNCAGGLLELESQNRTVSMFGFSSSGSTRIFTVSGAKWTLRVFVSKSGISVAAL